MPQCKLNFLGAHGLDPEMPKILWDRMHEDEWRSFVADINYAIREAQSTMNMSPWVILAIVGICISLVVVDIAVGGVFGNPTAGVITMAVFTLCGTCVVCYTSLVKPTSTLEEMIEIICEDYSDDEQEIYFFYRHHANVRVTENRFYLEVFVQEDPLPPYEPPQKPRKLPEEPQPEETDWEPDTVGEEETEATSTALVPFKDEPDDESQALVPFQEPTPPTPPPFWHALVPFFGKKEPPPESQALVPLEQPPPPETSQALVPLDQPPTSQALVPLGQEPETSQALVPLGQPETSQALVPLDQPPPESQALVPLETSMVPRDGQPQPPPDMSQALVPHEPDAESRSLVPLDVDRARQALAALNQQQLAPPVASDGEETMPVTGQVPYGSDYRDPAPYSQHMPPPLPGSRDPAPYSYPPPQGQPGDPAQYAAAVPPGTEGPVPYGENFRDPAPYSWFPRFGRAAPPPAAGQQVPPAGTARQVPPGQPPQYASAVPPEGPVPYGENFRDPAPYSWLPGFGWRAGQQQQQAPPPTAGQAPPPGQQVPPGQPPQYAAAVPPPEGAVPYGENYRDPAPYSWLPGFGRRAQAPPQGQQGQPAQYAPPPGTEGTGPVPYGEHSRDPAPYSATYPRPGQVPPPGQQQQQQGDPTQQAAAMPQAVPPAQQSSGQTRAPHSTSGPRPAQVQTPWWKLWAQPTEPAPAPAPATVPVAAPSDDDESSVEEAAAIPSKKKKKKKKKAKQPKKPKTVPTPDESQESMVSDESSSSEYDESSSSEYDESSSSEYDESSVEEAASIPAKKEKKKKMAKPPKKPKTVPVPDESPQSMVSDESSSSEYESSSSEEEEEAYTAPKAKAKKQSRAAKDKKLGKLDQDVEDLMDESDKKSESFADWGTQTAAAAKKKKPAAPMPWADEEAQAGEELEQIEDDTEALAKEQAKNAAAFDAMSAMRRFGGGWSWGASSSSKATAMEEDDKEEDENTAAQQAKMADLRKSLGSDKADSSVPWTSDEELGEEIAHDDDALMAEHAKNKAALRGKASKGRPSVMDEDEDDELLEEQEQNAVAQARMEDLRKSFGAGKASGAATSVPWTSDEELGEEIEKLKEDDETLLYEHAKNKAAGRRASEAGAETAADAAEEEDDEMDEGQAPSTVAKAKMSELRKSLKAEAVASLPWALDEDDEIDELEPLEEEDDDLMLEHEKNTAAFSSVAAMRKSWTDPESGEAKAEEASAVKGADDDEEDGWDKEQGPSEATRELTRDLRKSWVAAGFLPPEPEPAAAAVPWATDEEAGVEVELEEIEDIDDLMEEHARNTAAVERAEAAAGVSDGSAEDDDDDEDVTTNRDSKGNVFFDL